MRSEESGQEPLLNISEASRILGVSEAALRLWTDEGKIKAFITPGGHRRYSREDLKKLMQSSAKMLRIKDLASELGSTIELHRQIGRKALISSPWYSELGPESQERLAEPGRRLLGLIIKYVTESSKRDETLQMAHSAGRDLGEMLARLGLPLTDSVEAFLSHRSPILNAVTNMVKRKEAVTGRIVEAIPLVTQVMDEALVALVAAHQSFPNGLRDKMEGGIPI